MINEVNDEFYDEYVKLNGKKTKDEYFKMYVIFLKYTTGWIGGECYTKLDGNICENRQEEIKLLCIEAKISFNEYNRLLKSIDNIHSYS
jgi:hypothetical protein